MHTAIWVSVDSSVSRMLALQPLTKGVMGLMRKGCLLVMGEEGVRSLNVRGFRGQVSLKEETGVKT
jgi:hypothetical protein